MGARIKIEGQREKVNVYVDGKPLKGVLSLNYKARPGELPRVFIGMAADDIEIESDCIPIYEKKKL